MIVNVGAIFDWRIRRMMMRKTVTLPSKIDEEKHEHCGSSSSRLHFAVLNLVLESPYVGVVEKDVRVTWTEKFGMLGNRVNRNSLNVNIYVRLQEERSVYSPE